MILVVCISCGVSISQPTTTVKTSTITITDDTIECDCCMSSVMNNRKTIIIIGQDIVAIALNSFNRSLKASRTCLESLKNIFLEYIYNH